MEKYFSLNSDGSQRTVSPTKKERLSLGSQVARQLDLRVPAKTQTSVFPVAVFPPLDFASQIQFHKIISHYLHARNSFTSIMKPSTQLANCDIWLQWASTQKAQSKSLLDDEDDEEIDYLVRQHMQITPLPNAEDSCLPNFPVKIVPGMTQLEPAQSGALPMVPLQRCNRS